MRVALAQVSLLVLQAGLALQSGSLQSMEPSQSLSRLSVHAAGPLSGPLGRHGVHIGCRAQTGSRQSTRPSQLSSVPLPQSSGAPGRIWALVSSQSPPPQRVDTNPSPSP